MSVNWVIMVKVMLCRLFGAKPLPEPVLTYSQLSPYRNKLQWYLYQYLNIFIEENAFDNVLCKISAILYQHHRVNGVSQSVEGFRQWLLQMAEMSCEQIEFCFDSYTYCECYIFLFPKKSLTVSSLHHLATKKNLEPPV